MTEHHQNIDVHHVSVMSTENRVSGVMDLENGKCIPSTGDHILQRRNFITLVEQVIVANIRSLEFLADVVTPHIQHKYSSEMRKKDKYSKSIYNDNGHVVTCSTCTCMTLILYAYLCLLAYRLCIYQMIFE